VSQSGSSTSYTCGGNGNLTADGLNTIGTALPPYMRRAKLTTKD
jgi:hypothetical protein